MDIYDQGIQRISLCEQNHLPLTISQNLSEKSNNKNTNILFLQEK